MAFAQANWATVSAAKAGNAPNIYSYKSAAGALQISDGGQTLVATNTAGVITTAVI